MDKNQILTQVLVPALANLPTMTIVTLGVIYNNARLSDLRSSLTAVIEANANVMHEKLVRVEHTVNSY